MSFTSISSSLIQVGKAITQGLMQMIKDDLDNFNTKIGTLSDTNTPNGSFEIDADKDDVPDLWTRNLYTGGAGGLSPSQVIGTDGLNYTCIVAHIAAAANKPITGGSWATYWAQKGNAGATWVDGKHYKSLVGAHGERCTWLEHPGGAGNGGGFWDSDYEVCDELLTRVRSFKLYATTGTNLRVMVQHMFYDKDKVIIGTTTDVYNVTTPPTSWAQQRAQFVPPANARFMKVRLVGGYTDTDPGSAQTVYFDDVKTEEAKTPTNIKTTIGEVSNSGNGVNQVLPGGEYGFYPNIKMSGTNNIQWAAWLAGFPDANGIPGSFAGWTTYRSNIGLFSSGSSISAQIRYMTSSGSEFWLFILVKKTTGEVLAAYAAPDHPCYGNGDDENIVPHPFSDYLKGKISADLEIALIDMDSIRVVQSQVTKQRSFLTIVNEDYIVDMGREIPFVSRDIDGHRMLTEKHISWVVRGLKKAVI